MGLRQYVEIEGESEGEYVTPAKRPRLKLRLSEPKVPRPSNAENPQDAEAKGGRARTLMETPSRREGLSEEQERRFRMAVCKSSDEVLGALLCGLEQEDALALKRSEVQRAQIHAYHAVQLYFTMKSFQSSNIEAATLLAAWKAVKDTRILVSAERFVQVLQEQEVALEALGLHPTQWLTEEAMNLERWANGASISRCVDLSLVDGLAQRWVQRLQRDEELHGDAVLKLRETARTLVVEAMLGPAPLMFPPVTLAAAATTLGVMKSLDALKASSEEIKGRIKKENVVLIEASPGVQAAAAALKEHRDAMKENRDPNETPRKRERSDREKEAERRHENDESDVFEIGSTVELVGLKTAQAYNGQQAEVLSVDRVRGRYEIRLHDGSVKTIRAENVKLLHVKSPRPKRKDKGL